MMSTFHNILKHGSVYSYYQRKQHKIRAAKYYNGWVEILFVMVCVTKLQLKKGPQSCSLALF